MFALVKVNSRKNYHWKSGVLTSFCLVICFDFGSKSRADISATQPCREEFMVPISSGLFASSTVLQERRGIALGTTEKHIVLYWRSPLTETGQSIAWRQLL